MFLKEYKALCSARSTVASLSLGDKFARLEAHASSNKVAFKLIKRKEAKRMSAIIINMDKCTGCGLCASDCPNACLQIEDGKAYTDDVGCIECGHCFAICPKGAIEMSGYDCETHPVVSMTEIDSEIFLNAIKSRRSIRRFKSKPIEEEKLQKILEAGRYSPTGANAQNVSFTILGNKQDEIEKVCVDLFRKIKKIGSPFAKLLRKIEITDDFFFKGAPLVIVVSSKSSINAGLASAYMELMANSLGLGVLYSGFLVVCAKLNKKLRETMQLPKGQEIVSCLVIGYTDIKYKRIAPRKPSQVNSL